MHIITDDWIGQHATGRAGWTRAQLACLGVPWPPPKGWRHRLWHVAISDTLAREFERLGAARRQHLAQHAVQTDLTWGADVAPTTETAAPPYSGTTAKNLTPSSQSVKKLTPSVNKMTPLDAFNWLHRHRKGRHR